MSEREISDEDWKLLVDTFGDYAYEEYAHRHEMVKAIRRSRLRLVVDNTKK